MSYVAYRMLQAYIEPGEGFELRMLRFALRKESKGHHDKNDKFLHTIYTAK